MRADRLLSIMLLLRTRGSLPARELAAQLEVSERTVLRDMEALSSAGVPVYAERGRHGGFALLEGFRADVSALSEQEAQVLFAYTGLDTLTDLGLRRQIRSTLDKLASSAPPSIQHSASALRDVLLVDRRRWFVAPDDARHLPLLRQAALARRRVRMQYRSATNARSSTRTVDPCGLVENAGRWYLLAAHRRNPRTYRVSRIDRLEILDEAAYRPEGLDLRTEWEAVRSRFETPTPQQVRVRVRVQTDHESRFHAVASSQLVQDGQVTECERSDGAVVLEMAFRVRQAALGVLLGFAPHVELLAPADLRVELVARARAALDAHRTES